MRGLRAVTICAVLGLGLRAGAALANDTSLNLHVDPPRLLDGEYLPVRLAAEHIIIHFGKKETRVRVEFTFENLTDYEEHFSAGFPDEDLLYRYLRNALDSGMTEDQLFERYNLDYGLMDGDVSGGITGFKAWTRVAGQPPSANQDLPYRIIRVDSLASTIPETDFPAGAWDAADGGSLLLCRAFDLTLEPHGKVIVGHSYTAGTGANVESQSLFQYQLVTGRNWAGTIGEALIDVYVDDDLKDEGLYFGSPDLPDYAPVTVPSQDELKPLEPGHWRAVWRNFEPEGQRGWIYLATTPRFALEGAANEQEPKG